MKIRYEGESAYLNLYYTFFQEKVTDVCKKIDVDPNNISWVIFDPDKHYNKSIVRIIKGDATGADFGFYNRKNREIWISTKTLEHAIHVLPSPHIDSCMFVRKKIGIHFVASVLIDEITHFQTNQDHGTKEYDMKWKENVEKYSGAVKKDEAFSNAVEICSLNW